MIPSRAPSRQARAGPGAISVNSNLTWKIEDERRPGRKIVSACTGEKRQLRRYQHARLSSSGEGNFAIILLANGTVISVIYMLSFLHIEEHESMHFQLGRQSGKGAKLIIDARKRAPAKSCDKTLYMRRLESSLAHTVFSTRLLQLLCVAGFLFPAVHALGLDPNRQISQYGHTVWRSKDGLVPASSEITQTQMVIYGSEAKAISGASMVLNLFRGSHRKAQSL